MTRPFAVAPTIETPRLVLRADRAEDFEAYAAMWADPEVTRFIARPFSRSESWTRFLRNAGLWPILGYGYWAVEDKASGAYWGTVGFAEFAREIPAIAGIPEAGWGLVPAAQGKGLASEIVAAITFWADAHLPHAESCCIIDPVHGASIRVAEKNGFVRRELALYGDKETLVFKRPRAEVD